MSASPFEIVGHLSFGPTALFVPTRDIPPLRRRATVRATIGERSGIHGDGASATARAVRPTRHPSRPRAELRRPRRPWTWR